MISQHRPVGAPADKSPVGGMSGFSHEYLTTADTSLHYVVGGQGALVVLLHGWPFTWLEWRRTMPLLAAAGFRVVAPDARGAGDSAVPAHGWTKHDEAQDLHHLVRHLGATEVNVVGTDLGSMTAHAWAQAYPAEVRRLVLSEAYLPGFGLEEHMNPASGGSWHFGFHAQVELATMLTEGRQAAYLSGFWSMMSAGGITEADRADLLRTYGTPEGMRGGFERYATLAHDGEVARGGPPLTMPVLVLNGDRGLPQKVLLDGVRQAATARVEADIVPDSAHTIGADNPVWLASRLAGFLAPSIPTERNPQ